MYGSSEVERATMAGIRAARDEAAEDRANELAYDRHAGMADWHPDSPMFDEHDAVWHELDDGVVDLGPAA